MIGRLYEVVAATRSSDTFVALSLLVAAGMGAVAKMLGLTDTAGAFAAGVLLANSNFKYEISASILPFKGILLGVFFLDAGSNFDSELLLREGPTVATGVALLLLLKAFTLWLAGFIDRYLPTATDLAPAENIRLAVLLAGGGEFAFVVLAAAEKLGALPDELNGLLTTIVLITMSLTPLLGGAAAALSELAEEGLALDPEANGSSSALPGGDTPHVASDAIVICGYGEVGASVSRALLATAEEVACGVDVRRPDALEDGPPSEVTPSVVCFDLNASRLPRASPRAAAPSSCTATAPTPSSCARPASPTRAIIITYREPRGRFVSATQRLHANFPDAPIYARANGRAEREALVGCGASATILESEEPPCSSARAAFSMRASSCGRARATTRAAAAMRSRSPSGRRRCARCARGDSFSVSCACDCAYFGVYHQCMPEFDPRLLYLTARATSPPPPRAPTPSRAPPAASAAAATRPPESRRRRLDAPLPPDRTPRR